MKAEDEDVNKASAEGDAADEANRLLLNFLERGTLAIAGNMVLVSIMDRSMESLNVQS